MKKHIQPLALVLAAALMPMAASCVKETSPTQGNYLLLNMEKTDNPNSKMAIQDQLTLWSSNDQIWINGQNTPIRLLDEQTAWVSMPSVASGESFIAFAPANLITSSGMGGDYIFSGNDPKTVEVSFPSVYNYTYSEEGASGRVIYEGIPLGTTAEASQASLNFYHLSTLLNVELQNLSGTEITLDSVVISGRYYLGDSILPLSGWQQVRMYQTATAVPNSATTTRNAKAEVVTPYAHTTLGCDRVTIVFERDAITMANNTTKEIPVPIAPQKQLSATKKGVLTVRVCFHDSDGSAHAKISTILSTGLYAAKRHAIPFRIKSSGNYGFGVEGFGGTEYLW